MDRPEKCRKCGHVWDSSYQVFPQCPKCFPKKTKDDIIAEQNKELYRLNQEILKLKEELQRERAGWRL